MNVLLLALALQWTQVAVVDSVDITVHQFDTVRDLGEHLQTYGLTREADRRTGYARLYRVKSSGQFKCDVFIVTQSREKLHQELLAHEVRHCHGWAH